MLTEEYGTLKIYTEIVTKTLHGHRSKMVCLYTERALTRDAAETHWCEIRAANSAVQMHCATWQAYPKYL